MVRIVFSGLFVATCICLTGCGGCGTSAPVILPQTDAEKNLTSIVLAYLDATEELHHNPKNAEEIKPFLKRFGDPNQILISPTDGEPYVVVWGASLNGGPTPYKQMFPIMAYEKKGSGGKRAIADVRGRTLTVPNEDFPQLKFVGGHQPAAN
jgi:hypothetical protein